MPEDLEKRQLDGGAMVESNKKARTVDGAIVKATPKGGALVTSGPQRTSELLAPIMLLSGHSGAVNTAKFSPDGRHLLSGSQDHLVLLWDVFGECKNSLTFRGHSNSVVELHWAADGEYAFTASADKTVALWDAKTAGRVRQFKGHSSFVNTCCPADNAPVMASGSDDRNARIWDTRVRTCQRSITHPWQVTAVSMSADGMTLFTGSLDGNVRGYDLRRPDELLMMMKGHQDAVTGTRLSPDGNSLLSNAMDNTMRRWDVKPFAAGDRCLQVFRGAQHNYEKGLLKCAWSKKGNQVSAGSADNFVYVWDAQSSRVLYKLPGHTGSVNEVDFHPTQPIICSCSNDRGIYLGEIRAS